MLFREIPGLEEVKGRLVRAVREGRLAHAYLFHGEEGSAALPLALALAQYLLCESPGDDACGQCPACQKTQALVHPDLHFSFPYVKKGSSESESLSSLFLEEWRAHLLAHPYTGLRGWFGAVGMENKQAGIFRGEAGDIIRRMSLTPYEAQRKVLVMWRPELMGEEAANTLLKIIEEPPEDTFFLLVTADTDKVLPTIVSRCQAVRVPAVDDASLRSYLQERYGLQGEALEQVVVRAAGNMEQALLLAEESEGDHLFLDLFVRWMRLAYALNVPGLVEWTDEVMRLGREKQKLFLQYTLQVLRENLMMNLLGEQRERVRLTDEEYAFSVRFYRFIRPDNIEAIYHLLSEAWDHIAGNVNGKLVFMDVSLKLNRLLKK